MGPSGGLLATRAVFGGEFCGINENFSFLNHRCCESVARAGINAEK